ncbi:MAG: HD-GYP domain-containing protein [Planctomycetota bacterium]|jgi:HD-GYP domain-containing protein (c-di-GMP phosphodiesterase class II)
MIEKIDQALYYLQAALDARRLYPSGHPDIESKELDAWEPLESLLAERASLAVFALDDRIVADGKALPSSRRLAANLFKHVQELGVDRIEFHRGLTRQELNAWMGCLAAGEWVNGGRGMPHLSFGFIAGCQDPRAFAPEGEGDGGAELSVQKESRELRSVWQGIQDDSPQRTEQLGMIVSMLSGAVLQNRVSLLPLAQLKDDDEYTFTHTINVAILSTALGEALGIGDQPLHDLMIAALLHDMGKIAVPDKVLNKKGRLTDAEMALVQRHPEEGARMLFNDPTVPKLAAIVAFEHHIHCDGSGYPNMGPGWETNLASQVVQVADVYDALRTIRPYRPSMPHDQVVEIMQKDAGSLLDPDLLKIFLDYVVTRDGRDAAATEADKEAVGSV